MNDLELLDTFARQRSQEAFRQLMARHQDWVYCVCLRRLGDAALAEDAVQAVFLALAQRAGALSSHGDAGRLAGWLYVAARHAVANLSRDRARRARREKEAIAMKMHEARADPGAAETRWREIEQLLEPALDRLAPRDREAVLLRYYQQLSLNELAQALSISEEAAKKRVQRAVENLRSLLVFKGVAAPSMVLGTLLLGHVVKSAPASLAVIPAQAAGAAAAREGAANLARDILHRFSVAKLKAAALAGTAMAALLAVTVALVHARKPPEIRLPATVAAPAVVATAAVAETAPATSPQLTFRVMAQAVSNDVLQKRYVDMFESLDERRDLEAALAARRRNLPGGAQRAPAEAALRAELASAMVQQWNNLERAARMVAAEHSIQNDIPPGVPNLPITPARDVSEVLPIIRQRMVVPLDENSARQAVEWVNEQYRQRTENLDKLKESPEVLAALRRLLDAGNALNFSEDADLAPEQFELSFSIRIPAGDTVRPNDMDFVVARNRDQVVLIVYDAQSQAPLFYARRDMAILVSTARPNVLQSGKKSPAFNWHAARAGGTFDVGLKDHALIDVDFQGVIQWMIANMRNAELSGNRLLLTLPHSQAEIDLARGAAKASITRLTTRPLPGTIGPLLTISIHAGPPRDALFSLTPEQFAALKVDAIEDLPGPLSLMSLFESYLMADLKRDPGTLAAAREMARLLPPPPATDPSTRPSQP